MTARIDRASRTIRASPSAVYRAFEDPQAMESWLPPAGMRCEDVPGGIRPEDHAAGLSSTLENLARFTE